MTTARRRRRTLAALAGFAAAVFTAEEAQAQSADIFCQPIACGTFRELRDEDKDKLQDPFFQRVLKLHPDVTTLTEIELLIAGPRGQRRFFVVDEEIKASDRPGGRRATADFFDEAGRVLNVMISFSFDDTEVPKSPDLEVLAWDGSGGVFNYYKLNAERPPNTPPGRSWKLEATSLDADLLRPEQRRGTCLGCHTSGAPVMKELRPPWNNWHSRLSEADYLTSGQWPVAVTDSHFRDLKFAEAFEGAVANLIETFNASRLERLIRREQGKLVVENAVRLLRPLFETTEINFTSARPTSRLHPLLPGPYLGPPGPISIPNSFFLPAAILGAADIGEAHEFQSVATVSPAEYKALVENFGLKIAAGSIGTKPGDAYFTWFMPEQGFVATHWIETLVSNQLVSKAFVAAAAAADLENPIFSAARTNLLKFIPASFTVTPGENHPDALTRAVIEALRAANPKPGSVEAEFLATLEAADPVAVVRARVVAYRDRIVEKLGPGVRQDELRRLFGLLIERRRAFRDHPVFCNLRESNALLPLPDPNTPLSLTRRCPPRS